MHLYLYLYLCLYSFVFASCFAKTHVKSFWQSNTRPDGRAWTQVRPTTVVPSVLRVDTASLSPSSALVRLGKTHVMGAVSWNIGQTTPSSQSPSSNSYCHEHGDLLVQIESAGHYTNTAAAAYTSLQGYVQRILTETLDLTQLSIRPGMAWRAVVTCQVLTDAGNLTDAIILAAVAALHQSRIPINLTERHRKLFLPSSISQSNSTTKPFQMLRIPSTLTIGVWNVWNPSVSESADNNNNSHNSLRQPQWIVDPTSDEETALDGKITLLVVGDTLWGVEFVAVGRGGTGISQFAMPHLTWLQSLAVERAKEVQALILSDEYC